MSVAASKAPEAEAAEPTLVQALARFCAETDYHDLPDAVRKSLRERMLDIFGLILAARPLETSDAAYRVACSWGGPQTSTLLGFEEPEAERTAGDRPWQRSSAVAAGFLNGTLAHSLDFDDTHLPSVLHPSASLVPGLVALAEELEASSHELLAALAVGFEVCVRTGMAAYDRELGNSVFFERGWHATSICGALAVAAAAAKLYGLDECQIADAMGIACSMGAGIIEGNRAGGSVKRLHCGWAAHSGLVAARCAKEGITGPPTAFEGRFGFYEAFCGGALFPEEITRGLEAGPADMEWSIPGIFYKPYPANHFTHAGIDAARTLRRELEQQGLGVDDIERIDLFVSSPTLRTIAQPREQKVRPQSGYHGQFSGPFTVATALLGDGGGLGVFFDNFTDEKVADPRYQAVMDKVFVDSSPDCDAIFPTQFPAILQTRMRSGQSFEHRVMANRGGPENPLSEDELRTKFLANARRSIAESRAEAIASRVLDPADRPTTSLL